jgi:hypothetical protein
MMRRLILAAGFFVIGHAAGAAPETAPPPPPQAQAPKTACADVRNSPDYVPSLDAYGRSVAPADLPGSSTDVQISTEVYADLRSRNPQLQGAGVMANLPGLETRAPCPQPGAPAPPAKR